MKTFRVRKTRQSRIGKPRSGSASSGFRPLASMLANHSVAGALNERPGNLNKTVTLALVQTMLSNRDYFNSSAYSCGEVFMSKDGQNIKGLQSILYGSGVSVVSKEGVVRPDLSAKGTEGAEGAQGNHERHVRLARELSRQRER